MFKKKTKIIKEDNGLAQKVNQDLIVHNMPDSKRLAGHGFLEKNGADVGIRVMAPKSNFKTVGIIIIAGGFIVIGVLIYFSYSFIIKPVTKNNNVSIPTVVDTNQATATIPVATTSAVVNVSTTTVMTTTTPSDLSALASSSDANVPLDALNGSTTDQIAPLLDSDNDGLYDEEEIALGTNPNLADTDGDTYTDLAELTSGYNPNGAGKLAADPALAKYSSKDFNYEILYPKAWDMKEVTSDNTVIFTAPDQSIIQVSVQDNSKQLSIASWYADAFSDDVLTYDRLKSGANWDGAFGSDYLNFYLTDKKHTKVYIVSYLPIFTNRLAYPNLFKALATSIILK